MIYTIKFSDKATKVLVKWKKSSPMIFKKAQKVISDIAEHPRIGIWHPEALKGGNDILYSRHITAHDRIVYEILDDIIEVDVVTIEGHYSDK